MTLPDGALMVVVEAIRDGDRFLLVTHENPDGDALGSILATKLALDQLGKDAVMFLGGDSGIPQEFDFMLLEDLARELPGDAAARTLFAVDCASAQRTGLPEHLFAAQASINVDHHHDNTRFARVNLIVPDASSTGEIVSNLLHELGVELTPAIAEALYVALVTDTGRFQYTNTTPEAHELAAELLRAGVDVQRVFQGIYESVDLAKLRLVGKALERAQVYEGGRLVVSYLLRNDFNELGVGEEYAEGVIDYVRMVDGAEMAAMIREPPEPPDAARRISLRSSLDEVDVSAIARKRGGGGHRRAAGFSSEDSIAGITEFIRSEFAEAHAAESA